MPDETTPDDSRRQRLDEVIGEFLVAQDAGQNPNPSEWLARHPELCPELAEFFADRERMDELVDPLKVSPDLTISVAFSDSNARDESGETRSLPKGTRVRYFGDYELERVLGEGGMGVVYKARQLSLNRAVALKMIKAARFASPDDLRRFQNEAEAVARLDHPNIVPIFEVGQFEHQQYFSMKLIAGESLDKRLKDYVADPRQSARLVAAIAGAIHHAHQRGILHRDLKPANVLVDAEGQPHVTDFGLAKRTEGDSELTQSGAILGTPAYMAPEQASGKRGVVTTVTDNYGLGAILYALLVGRAPFGGTTVVDTLEQVRERIPDVPRKLNPRVSRDLEVICMKCLEKDPRRRYASADALAEDLKRWLAGEPILARPVGQAARAWMWCRRNPGMAAATGLAATTLIVVALLSLRYARQQTQLAVERKKRLTEQVEATAKIDTLNKSLAKEGNNLKAALTDSDRQLAKLFFERAQRAFDSGRVNHGLLWLVECWRYAARADDHAWQRLARANLSFWRYYHVGLKGKFSHGYVSKHSFSPDGKTILIQVDGRTARLWNTTTERPIGQPMIHSGYLGSMMFSPDGKTLLTVSRDGTARLWESADCRFIGQLMLHQGTGYTAYSPDGKTIANVGPDGTARLWDATTARPVGQLMMHKGWINSVAFSPDSKTIVCASADEARLWNAATCQPLGKPLRHQKQVWNAAFSPDGRFVVTASADHTARLWDASTGSLIEPPMVHPGAVTRAEFNPDGKTVLTVCDDRFARLWDCAARLPVGPPLEYAASPWSTAQWNAANTFSLDGKTFLVPLFPDNKVRLGNAVTGLPVGKPLEHQGQVCAAAFNPEGNVVLTGSKDRSARFWDAATGQPLGNPVAHQSEVRSVAISPDGRSVLTAAFSDGTCLRNISIGMPLGQPLDAVGWSDSLAFSRDGTRVLTFDRSHCRVCDPRTGSLVGRPTNLTDGARTAAFSPDGKTILTGSWQNSVHVWNAVTGEPIGQPIGLPEAGATAASGRPIARVRAVQFVAFSPRGDLFLAINGAGTALLGDATAASAIRHHANIECAAFSPDGRIVAMGTSDNAARLWDTSTGASIGAPLNHGGPVVSVAFSPNGKTIATGSDDRTVQFWNIDSSQPVGPPLVHEQSVYSIAFSPDGNTIATEAQQTLRLWSAATAQAVGQLLMSKDGARHLAFSADGKTILATSESGARLWDIATGQPIGPDFKHDGTVGCGAFSPDGRSLITAPETRAPARLWHLPAPIEDDAGRIKVWVETITGLQVGSDGNIKALESEPWQQRHDRLGEVGGPPGTDSNWLFDPILYGADPTARARTWLERKCWAEAEVAFTDVIRARPLLSSAWIERGQFYFLRSEPEKAAADFAHALMLEGRGISVPDTVAASSELTDRVLRMLPVDAAAIAAEVRLKRVFYLVREQQPDAAREVLAGVATLAEHDAELSKNLLERGRLFAVFGFSAQVAALVRAHGRSEDPATANSLAWYCALAPTAISDSASPVILAERALDGFDADTKHAALNTLGAVLYRAGRFQEAIQRLEEAKTARKDADEPLDWPFLALAHHRLGHREEARRWLEKLRIRRPSTDPRRLWVELEIRLLSREAEVVILFDPIFPADPFAP
jgi:eukaryotic-like serine/threonine-protein kinase